MFNSAFAVSFHSTKSHLSQGWQWRYFSGPMSLLRIATNKIASFCKDNRLRQMAFFVSNSIHESGHWSTESSVAKVWRNIAVLLHQRNPRWSHTTIHEGLRAEHWKKKRRQKKLVGALSAQQLLFYAPLLRWYVEHGAVIKAVYRTTTWFVEQVTEVRCTRSNCWEPAVMVNPLTAGAPNKRQLHKIWEGGR